MNFKSGFYSKEEYINIKEHGLEDSYIVIFDGDCYCDITIKNERKQNRNMLEYGKTWIAYPSYWFEDEE